jgi:hypothetical protein
MDDPVARWRFIAIAIIVVATGLIGMEAAPRITSLWSRWHAISSQQNGKMSKAMMQDERRRIQDERLQMQDRLRTIKGQKTFGFAFVDVLRRLQQISKTHDVTIEEVRPGDRTQTDTHWVNRATIQANGDFPDIVQFLDAAEHDNLPLRMRRVSAVQPSARNSQDGETQDGIIVSLRFEVYSIRSSRGRQSPAEVLD